MIRSSPEDLADLRRWVISGALVVLAHGGIAAAMVSWHEPVESAEHAGGILVEFAPLPAAPPAPSTELAPGPEQVMSDAAPELKTATVESSVEISSKPIEQPPPEVPPAPNRTRGRAPKPEAKAASYASTGAACAGPDHVGAASYSGTDGGNSHCAFSRPVHSRGFESGREVDDANHGVA